MLKKTLLAMAFTGATLFFAASNVIGAASSPGVTLTGQVSPQEEGRMEGVLVSAKRGGVADIKALYRSSGTRYSVDEEPVKKKR